MKILNFLFAATLAIGLLAGCDANGKKYDYNKHQNIYYKGDGLDEAGAKKLASYLAEIKYFGSDKDLSVQITKSPESKDTVNINFVVDASKITPEIESAFTQIGGFISKKVYNDGPVTVCLIDDHFKKVRSLGYAKPLSDADPAPTEGGVQ